MRAHLENNWFQCLGATIHRSWRCSARTGMTLRAPACVCVCIIVGELVGEEEEEEERTSE